MRQVAMPNWGADMCCVGYIVAFFRVHISVRSELHYRRIIS